MSNALRYNQDKLKEGRAEFLMAENFLQEPGHLNRQDIKDRFLERTSLHAGANNNVVRISLNFDPAEKMPDEKMRVLTTRYMQRLGFEQQPFLVYRHYDTAHPHLHVVTTNIRADGSRIDTGRPLLYHSHQITRELENEFSLQRNKRATLGEKEKFNVQQAQRVIHGESGLQRAISNVLNTVIDHYKYTSLSELNAILQLYKVKASRGRETSRLYQLRGLIYHALGENGKPIGKAIKASDFFLKPTLNKLEKLFELNKSLRQEQRQRLTTAIDWTMAGRTPDWKEFKNSLEKDNISVVIQEDKKGDPESVYFVDHQAKAVFSGESLGDPYNYHAIRERCAEEQVQEQEEELTHRLHLKL
jgi:hypothetical protein